jgi:hypothetical protein
MMTRYKFIVLSNPVEGAVQEYNRWYDERHIPDVLAVDGVISAERSHLLTSNREDGPRQQYLAIYEIESDDLDATLAEIRARWGTQRMPMSDALDRSNILTMTYEVLKSRVESAPAPDVSK